MQAATASEPKPSKRRAPARPKTPEKQKLTLYVSVEASRRLGVHATMTGTDRSALVDRLIQENLRRFIVSDRAKPDDGVDRQESAAGASETAPAAA